MTRTMTRAMTGTRQRILLVVAGALFTAAGCSEYSYLDFESSLDTSYSITDAQMIASCQMFVTGAITDSFDIPTLRDDGTQWCPPASPNRSISRINYSTFTESGDVTFTLRGFLGTGQGCKIAEGSTTMKISKGATTKGPELKLVKIDSPGCP